VITSLAFHPDYFRRQYTIFAWSNFHLPAMARLFRICTYGIFLISVGGCNHDRTSISASWCDQPLRPEFSNFKEITSQNNWFKIYQVGEGVYAIAEPFNYQEVISYLITGADRNILFDTGMGMGRISEVVKKLSSLPVIVINSHTHYDHIGGNNEFDTVYAVDTTYTEHFSTKGWTHDQVKQEVTQEAFCVAKLPELDTASYSIRPYQDKIKKFIKDGDKIDLGNRIIEVLKVPGHTPDCVALLDRSSGYLWTGDMFYEATIWLFFEGTDLNAYEHSIGRFASLAPTLKTVFPAHNKPTAIPSHLKDLQVALDSIRTGKKKGIENENSNHPEDQRALTFKFEHFSFLIRKDQLAK
jgi:glyoxylase-like metal-dependent hydrolase (beta-lactamase superfamily II)